MKKNVVETIFSVVKSLNLPVTKTTIIREINENPHNETLFAISDALSKWKITNAAYRLTPDELDSDFCPFIAYMNKGIKEYEFVHVKSIDDKQAIISNENYKDRVIDRNQLNKLYNGTVLIIEPEPDAGEINYKVNRRKEVAESLKTPLLALAAVVFLSGLFIQSPVSLGHGLYWLLIKCAGLGASLLLVTQTLQADNPLAKSFCFKGKHADCDDILTAKASHVFPWLSWSEVGMFYFTATLLLLVFSYGTPGIPETLAVLSALCLPYVVYSLSYQAFVAKKWCVLCTSVQAVLVLEFFAYAGRLSNPFVKLGIEGYYSLALAALFPVLIWALLKPLLKSAGELSSARKTLAKFRNNDELFKKELSQQPAYNLPNEDFAIVLGNPASKKIVTIVSNPYCTPCSITHKELDDWLSVSDDLQVRVILTNTQQGNETARHLVALNNTGDTALVKQALHDWYKQSKKDYTSWAKKYPADLQSALCDEVMEKQSKWCETADVRFTPLVIVNGHQLPESYKIEDLKYLV